MTPIPDLVDNKRYQLAQVLKSLITQSKNPEVDVVTAYFNLKGLEVLEPALEAIVRLRVLLGKEQEQAFVVGKKLLEELEDATSSGEISTSQIKRWEAFFSQEHVSIKRYAKGFCHGKAYIVHGVPALGAIGIVGSSNLTSAGLTTNLELNAVLKQQSAVNELSVWFENLWNEAEDAKAEILELLKRFTRTYKPYEIYIKILYEALKDKLNQELQEKDEKPSPIALADFQYDGYLAAKEILENYGGVLIADSVGLGKTYLALRLLDDYAYQERQTALVICPAAVKDTIWHPLLQRLGIPHEIVSMEQVSRQDFQVKDFARYRIIVVDESHNFRNPHTNRWKNLFNLIANGESDKKIILLTATPVNNTVFDLYHQLRFITRDNPKMLLSVGIPDLWEYFRQTEQNKEALYEVLEALAVRRSRLFIKQHYPEAEIDGQKIRFPERELHTVQYSLRKTYGPTLYRKIAKAIEDLLLAPYQIEIYRRELVEARFKWASQALLFESNEEISGTVERLQKALNWSREQAHNFLMTIGRQTALAHIMRVLYLKRLESSIEALRISLRRLRNFLNSFLKALERGRLLKSDDYRRWLQMESSDEEGEGPEESFESFLDTLPEISSEHYDIDKMRDAVKADLHTVEEILTELDKEQRDDKLETLKQLLISPELSKRKIIIFSYFRDTARYIYQQLKNDYTFLSRLGHNQISIIDSKVEPEVRNRRIICFAPQAHKRADIPLDEQITLLISTDVLSEGQNLQDAEVVINYDLHWNPVRMVQRIGRVDRLGSFHDKIYVYNFFPEDELEELLKLLERLRQKLDAINRTVGLDTSILGETPNPMDFNTLRRIAKEDRDVLQELEAESELAVGEFLQQDLLKFLKRMGEEYLKRIPLGVGTARKCPEGANPGFFVAFRNIQTGSHYWLFLSQEPGRKERIIEQKLEAIKAIRCDESELPESMPADFDPRPLIGKLRRHLWNRLRSTQISPCQLPSIQRQVVNSLRTLPPSAERNQLLQYFECQPLPSSYLKDLKRLWRERTTFPPTEWMSQLMNFAESHPHLQTSTNEVSYQELREDHLECIAWVKIL